MLAPAIDPDNEKIIKIADIAYQRPFRWIIPRALRVATDEKYTHISELRKIAPYWSQLSIPICHVHGDKDSLVPFENLSFSERSILNAPLETITLKGEDHFIPWAQYDFVEGKILEYLNKIDTAGKLLINDE
jgi:pimeloyl-ACP methyl ester carboxylesterase